ncbi:hypothetical protein AB0L40_17875 [Patulibacter sp. NPDC049589]|uniref:hypothetical protein n=1 Tax=Patulibacter sp. NPDC049589 TaxID=3154731 RepID=UPI003417BBCF
MPSSARSLDTLERIGKFPCRHNSAGQALAERPVEAGIRNLRMDRYSWSGFTGRIELAASAELFARLQLSDGDSLRCSETFGGDSFPGPPIPVGLLLIPTFWGVELKMNGSATQTGGAFSLEQAYTFSASLDTARPGVFAMSATPRTTLTGQIAADFDANAALSFSAGVGMRKVANIRYELGPQLAVTVHPDGQCESVLRATQRLSAELVVKSWTLGAQNVPILGPISLPGCTVVDPIVGVWRSDEDEGDVRTEQVGPDAFRMVALQDLDVDGTGKCIWLTAGSAKEIRGSRGNYTSSFGWVDLDNFCFPVDDDPNGSMRIDSLFRDRLKWCGKTAERSSCDTWTRVKPGSR